MTEEQVADVRRRFFARINRANAMINNAVFAATPNQHGAYNFRDARQELIEARLELHWAIDHLEAFGEEARS